MHAVVKDPADLWHRSWKTNLKPTSAIQTKILGTRWLLLCLTYTKLSLAIIFVFLRAQYHEVILDQVKAAIPTLGGGEVELFLEINTDSRPSQSCNTKVSLYRGSSSVIRTSIRRTPIYSGIHLSTIRTRTVCVAADTNGSRWYSSVAWWLIDWEIYMLNSWDSEPSL